MATREYWIQIENKIWDTTPKGYNRMTGEKFEPKTVCEKVYDIDKKGNPVRAEDSEGKPITRKRKMYNPVEVLILRRYAPPSTNEGVASWSLPLDRKVNPWDLNEPDPTVTYGTIPGAILECDVGDDLVVHFRNMDLRHDQYDKPLGYQIRTHSLHPHGISFGARYDGAYPISPLDPGQVIPEEERRFFRRFGRRFFLDDSERLLKRSDLVPPGATFSYRWDTRGWSTTAGVWLYHDHSVVDHDNVLHGAIGMLVIHDRKNERDVNVNPDDVPSGSGIFPNNDVNGNIVVGRRYVDPPTHAQCLQLYHELLGVGMCINGRKFLGNTPTMVAGPKTLIRFGLGAMNNNTFHTFHLHGHRWHEHGQTDGRIIDTKIFGPADTFAFSIQEGSSEGPPPDELKGEWHMHCHVLNHMMGGMMGSLLIVEGGDQATEEPLMGLKLPHKVDPSPAPRDAQRSVSVEALSGSVTTADRTFMVQSASLNAKVTVKTAYIGIRENRFDPSDLTIESGTEVIFEFDEGGHTVTTSSIEPPNSINPIEINAGQGPNDPVPRSRRESRIVNGPNGSILRYQCGLHGENMQGVIRIKALT